MKKYTALLYLNLFSAQTSKFLELIFLFFSRFVRGQNSFFDIITAVLVVETSLNSAGIVFLVAGGNSYIRVFWRHAGLLVCIFCVYIFFFFMTAVFNAIGLKIFEKFRHFGSVGHGD